LYVSLRALPRVLDQYCGLTGPDEFNYYELTEAIPWLTTGLEFVGVRVPPVQTLGPGGLMIQGDGVVRDQSPRPTGPVRIRNVIPGSPAQKAGVRPGDLIVKVGGHRPESTAFAASFRRLLPIQPGVPLTPQPGHGVSVQLTLLRSGRAAPLEVTVAP